MESDNTACYRLFSLLSVNWQRISQLTLYNSVDSIYFHKWGIPSFPYLPSVPSLFMPLRETHRLNSPKGL